MWDAISAVIFFSLNQSAQVTMIKGNANRKPLVVWDSRNKKSAASVVLGVRPARDFSLVAAAVALHRLQARRRRMKSSRPVAVADGASQWRRHERPWANDHGEQEQARKLNATPHLIRFFRDDVLHQLGLLGTEL
jgi:hypothetical protein